jgi:tryptophan-rich sensory protein
MGGVLPARITLERSGFASVRRLKPAVPQAIATQLATSCVGFDVESVNKGASLLLIPSAVAHPAATTPKIIAARFMPR